MKAIFVQTCNIWKSDPSPVGVYTNRKALEKQLRFMLKKGYIELNEGSPIQLPLKNFSIKEMHDNIDYISIQEIELNSPF